MADHKLWQAKLAARVHDPAEKALVLMRDPAGHEGGTTYELFKLFFPNGVDTDIKNWIKKADHWASAADRPQFPQDANSRFAKWAQVRFDQSPEIKHPLTGESADLGKLSIEPAHIKAFSTASFLDLIERDANGTIDWRKTLLSFWRFGPELNPMGIGHLWRFLPADTRVPDHTIWAHLDLTSAFCGAFAADAKQQPALLNVSFGPVQSFIAAGRSTSDLWAGSHLLSRIAWEGMKVICERLGPDAIIFPQLRGVPQVDLWLQNEMGLPANRFKDCEWRTAKTDANPLFSAALPNKFMALVPASLAKELAEQITEHVRLWVMNEAEAMLDECLEIAQLKKSDLPCYRQLREQLDGFPEVYWAAVPWLCEQQEGSLNTEKLQQAMHAFYPESNLPGFLGSELWKTLNQAIEPEQGWKFYKPNPGVLYPAVYDLLDRVAAAAKATRTFQQKPQQGYRNTLSGEYEWLTTDEAQLCLSPGQRQNTLWQRVAAQKPSWVKNGEHLSALDMLKRLWPNHFIKEIKNSMEDLQGINRYVVSTHDMAFSTNFERWLKNANRESLPIELLAILEGWQEQSALPKKVLQMAGSDQQARLLAKKLPSFWEAHCDNEDLKPNIKSTLNDFFQESYYALILMDGDNMGAWLTGNEEKYQLGYHESWHRQLQANIDQKYRAKLNPYLQSKRHASPARHMAISDALNGFSLDLARYVVEGLYKGKLLYAGGDDVMAMVAVDDLLPMMLLLRLVYSGIFPVNGDPQTVWKTLLNQDEAVLQLKNGYVLKDDNLYRVMGPKATASCGAVIAHHTAPLGQVLKTLRAAEQRAKKQGGRDAFAIDVLKRSGGAVKLTSKWFSNPQQPESLLDSPIGQLIRLKQALAEPNMSRRAAYIAQDWLRRLPPDSLFSDNPEAYKNLLKQALEYPLIRQNQGVAQYRDLAKVMVDLGMRQNGQSCTDFITHFIGIAEFLARDSRAGGAQ
ncbi:MAG: type III-B CRISPR-associated protein Cas10/Cmr2 [Gammaproteobacteria bacterium]|nr:type III-B CRISPR-associated protein Cas10/Cmr2 [Gammaproteobacteria bacterium]